MAHWAGGGGLPDHPVKDLRPAAGGRQVQRRDVGGVGARVQRAVADPHQLLLGDVGKREALHSPIAQHLKAP